MQTLTRTTRRKWLFLGGVSALGMAVLLLALPTLIFAQTSTSVTDESEAEENIIISPDDKPLERQAKQKRRWVVFHEADSPKVYAIKKTGTKHEIQTVAFFAKFNANYLVKLVKPGRLANFPEGDPIVSVDNLNPSEWRKHAKRHRLVKLKDKPAVYLITPDGKRRVIIAEGPFHRFGWEFRDVEEVNASELESFSEDSAIDDNTVFDEDVDVDTSHKRKLKERLKERLKLRGKKKVKHRLIKKIGDNRIFLMDKDGKLHHIKNERVARRKGLNLKDTTEVSDDEFEALEIDKEVSDATPASELEVEVED